MRRHSAALSQIHTEGSLKRMCLLDDRHTQQHSHIFQVERCFAADKFTRQPILAHMHYACVGSNRCHANACSNRNFSYARSCRLAAASDTSALCYVVAERDNIDTCVLCVACIATFAVHSLIGLSIKCQSKLIRRRLLVIWTFILVRYPNHVCMQTKRASAQASVSVTYSASWSFPSES